jgi:hypothetical protein
MGSNAKHQTSRKLTVPDFNNVTALYGQLAAKDQGTAKYVRFIYPSGVPAYDQVNAITSPSSQFYGVLWYGTDLRVEKSVTGRWFLNQSGATNHIPRAFLLYPTYTDPTRQWVNVFEPLDAADTQVYWDVANGWTKTRQVIIDIPAPLVAATMTVEVALVDNDNDTRPIVVKVTAGAVSQTQQPTGPNRGDLLNILTFTLPNVQPGTDQIVIDITSPDPFTSGLGAAGGDSGALVGVTANYECVDD